MSDTQRQLDSLIAVTLALGWFTPKSLYVLLYLGAKSPYDGWEDWLAAFNARRA